MSEDDAYFEAAVGSGYYVPILRCNKTTGWFWSVTLAVIIVCFGSGLICLLTEETPNLSTFFVVSGLAFMVLLLASTCFMTFYQCRNWLPRKGGRLSRDAQTIDSILSGEFENLDDGDTFATRLSLVPYVNDELIISSASSSTNTNKSPTTKTPQQNHQPLSSSIAVKAVSLHEINVVRPPEQQQQQQHQNDDNNQQMTIPNQQNQNPQKSSNKSIQKNISKQIRNHYSCYYLNKTDNKQQQHQHQHDSASKPKGTEGTTTEKNDEEPTALTQIVIPAQKERSNRTQSCPSPPNSSKSCPTSPAAAAKTLIKPRRVKNNINSNNNTDRRLKYLNELLDTKL